MDKNGIDIKEMLAALQETIADKPRTCVKCGTRMRQVFLGGLPDILGGTVCHHCENKSCDRFGYLTMGYRLPAIQSLEAPTEDAKGAQG